jgi:hypothetical protein
VDQHPKNSVVKQDCERFGRAFPHGDLNGPEQDMTAKGRRRKILNDKAWNSQCSKREKEKNWSDQECLGDNITCGLTRDLACTQLSQPCWMEHLQDISEQ